MLWFHLSEDGEIELDNHVLLMYLEMHRCDLACRWHC
jgi:hypothetical protein